MSDRCPRCGGSFMRQRDLDEDGHVRACLSCGRRAEIGGAKAMTETQASIARDGRITGIGLGQPGTAPPSPQQPQDWRAAARAELDRLIAQVAKAEQTITAARVEAQRIRTALAAYGVGDLPELPWTAAVNGSAGRTPTGRKKPDYGSCVRCGRVFTGSRHYRRTADGRRYCLKGACAEHAAVGAAAAMAAAARE